MTIDWSRVLEAAAITVSIILYLAKNRRSDKKEALERAEALDKRRLAEHQENSQKLDDLISERQYLKAHDHIETVGPLTAEGVIRRRNGK